MRVINPYGLHVYGEARDKIEAAYHSGESSVEIDGKTVNIETFSVDGEIELRVEVV